MLAGAFFQYKIIFPIIFIVPTQALSIISVRRQIENSLKKIYSINSLHAFTSIRLDAHNAQKSVSLQLFMAANTE